MTIKNPQFLTHYDAVIMAKISAKSFVTFCTYYAADKQAARDFLENRTIGFCRCEQCQSPPFNV